jgi:hypothetical protein
MTLPIQITFRHMNASPALEAAVGKEARKLARFFPRVMNCRVALEGPSRHGHTGLSSVRIDLWMPGAQLAVEHKPDLRGHLHEVAAEETLEGSETLKALRDTSAVREAFHEMRRRLQDQARRMREPPASRVPVSRRNVMKHSGAPSGNAGQAQV